MAIRTSLFDVLGIDHPIVQAPIGSATNPDLAAAVSSESTGTDAKSGFRNPVLRQFGLG
ncbi:hypothetical protein ACFQGT_15330 [Natrialbaceae archaeon GCM10025810]|uniref:hypothetical protein n=1 Tax=Halovalidus salilacus TaxID=3075124 RepID=UPI0036060EB3